MSDTNVVAAEANASPVPQTEASPRLRILLVDDDTQIRELSAGVLGSSGYEVRAVEDGAVAWNALQRDRFDLIITDNSMPNVSGFELLELLHAAGCTTPVIMATGSTPEKSTRYPELWPAILLLKPYTSEDMVRAVKAVLPEAAGAAVSPDIKP